MGDTPTTENATALFFDNVIQALLEGGVEAAIVYITGVAPEAMAVPIVNFGVKEILGYVEQIVSVAAQKMATSIVIDVQTKGEKSSVITTATALQYALASGNKTDIDFAVQNLSKAYASLIHSDGSAQPVNP